LTIAGNDIYQNTTYDLRNDSGSAVVANSNYWGSPTTTQLSQGTWNLSRIYDIRDGGQEEALITQWYAAPLSSGNPGPLQNFPYTLAGVTQVVSGSLNGSQAWNGTVLVVGDVTVTGSLTIDPGTEVLFDALHDTQTAGLGRSRCELILNGGSLTIAGTADAPIVFTSAAAIPHPGDWYGIRVVTGDVTMSNCVVEYATEGVRFESADTRFNNYALGNVTVERCSGDGVWTTSGQYAEPVVLNNFQLWTNGTGLTAVGPVTLMGGQVVGNSGRGISAYAAVTATGTVVSLNGNLGVNNRDNPTTLTGCVVSWNGSTGVYNELYNGGNNSATLTGCVITNNQGDGVGGNYYGPASPTLHMSGCTVLRNNGWGLNVGMAGAAEVWNNLVQSNGSGGMTFNNSTTVGLVSNTITGNSGIGLSLQIGGVSASGIAGNVITGNAGVGVEVQSGPSVLTIAGNDIYQNTTYDLRDDCGSTIIATNEYWGEPTTTEFDDGVVNLSRIYDSHDNPSDGQVLVEDIRGASTQMTLHFTLQPQSVVANVGDTVTLSPAISGVGPISYQWFDDGLVMPQATNLILTMPGVTVGNSGGYFLVISNVSGVVTSSVALVAVILPPGSPTITQQPSASRWLPLAQGHSATCGKRTVLPSMGPPRPCSPLRQ
jgi:hypothetical protein